MKLFIVISSLLVLANCKCPLEGREFYSHPKECDRYDECREGVLTENLLCPDGLLFNEAIATTSNFPCSYPNEVDCGSRTGRQAAVPTEHCDHQWGYYGSGDRAVCDEFWNCVDGREYPFTCPDGLAFSSETSRCEWPEESPDCDVTAYLGFQCADDSELAQRLAGRFLFYASPKDCRRYFLCLGTSPRLQVCELGKVFNEEIQACDEPEVVRGCEAYYPPEQLKAIRDEKKRQREAKEKRIKDRQSRKAARN